MWTSCLTPQFNHIAALGILLLGLDALPAQTWLRHRTFLHPLSLIEAHHGHIVEYSHFPSNSVRVPGTVIFAPDLWFPESLITFQCVLTSLVILLTL